VPGSSPLPEKAVRALMGKFPTTLRSSSSPRMPRGRLADRSANTYGGVYVFSDADAQAAYANSELFAAVAGNPNLTGLTSRAFDVLAGPTAVTRGGRLDADRTPA
jgi:hypothetical protein